jgi:transcriptional regulator with XRE-family HTH domain
MVRRASLLEGMGAKTRAAQRIRQFLIQRQADWQAETGRRAGFQVWAAEQMKRHKRKANQSTISRYMADGSPDPDAETLEAIVDTFRLRPDWILLPKLPETARYTSFLFGTAWAEPPSPYEACERFIETAEQLGGVEMPITDDERAFLRSQTWPSEPSISSYMDLLRALRSCAKPRAASSPGTISSKKAANGE